MLDLMRVTKSEVSRTVNVLARAFHDDPLWSYAVADPIKRSKALRHLFYITSAHVVHAGEIYKTSSDFEGVAIWMPPGKTMTVMDALRVGFPSMLMALWHSGFSDFRRIMQVLDAFETRQKQDAPAKFWHLMQMGVEPEHQGKGLGSQLLKVMLTRLDHNQETCYLETETPRNVAFYEKYGFQVVTEAPIKDGGPILWTMVRKPG